jgi:hypothetical protein
MKSLQNAIEDYIALRRSLGFKLNDMAADLTKFASFLEQKAAPYITTALALEWAMQSTDPAKPVGSAIGFRSRVRPPLERNRSPHRNSARRFTPVSSAASPSLSLHRTGDSEAAGCCQKPLTGQRASAMDLSLLIRSVGSQWAPDQRGNQAERQDVDFYQRRDDQKRLTLHDLQYD